MNENMAIGVVGMVGVMVLVGSGIVRQRMPLKTTLRLALLWLGIFVLAWAIATLGLRLAKAG